MKPWPFDGWQLAATCLGGAVGTGARALLAAWALRTLGAGFPYGTLAVNAIGSFLIGLIMHLSLTQGGSATWRMVLTTGVMGGFTTYSTFNYETLSYLRSGAVFTGLLNIAATVLLCLLLGLAGIVSGRLLLGR